ncbi:MULTISPECIES: VOC family protein [Gordonia]|uniref:VOC family protein n=1 Tax=Gordonia TaxID=2053 RepID=UPI00071C3D24|nr:MULTISPECIES: VOC family protein [Gordonia]KSU56877.1 glyoxalase [Gordonia sp. SGD-V-85]MBR7190569.1 VOC family protein [Gordonia sp. SCSIO 19800]MDT0220245.1 VOC family protein [Gordonia sp. AC31]UPG69945.1 VOC family protein [Gordonia hongkongensis]SCC44798.1 Glyoxalase-like domain-containing protein [Gordonia sp. v-85]
MPVSFNHIIIGAHDPQESADFYLDVLGARPAPGWGPFVNILLDDDTLLQLAPAPVAEPIHMAFLMDDIEFDRGYDALRRRGVDHWADPQMRRPNEISTEEGRRVYFKDPSGQLLEMLTEPYV